MKVNRVLGIDPGKSWGYAVYSGEGVKKCAQWEDDKFTTLKKFKDDIENLVFVSCCEAVFTCRAMGHSNPAVTRFHGALNGIIEIICEERGIYYADIADSTMRKEIIGKGNAKKEEVMEFTGIPNDHAADAMIAAMYGYKMLEKVL